MKTVATIAELVRYLTEYDPDHNGSIIDQYYGYEGGLEAFYDDTLDAIDNGEVEFKFDIVDEGDALTFTSHEGVVRVTQNGRRGLNVSYESSRRRDHFTRTRDHFTRTRDMVYATGNKWAIENFNLTHY